MSTRHRIAAAATAALTLVPLSLAATAADAGAAKPKRAFYRLVYDADVTYRHVRETEDGAFKEVTTASFHVRGKADGVEVIGGQLDGPVPIVNLRASEGLSRRVSTTDEGTNVSCAGRSVLSTAPTTLFPGAPVYGWPKHAMALLPFFNAELFMACTASDGTVYDETLSVSNAAPQKRKPQPMRYHVRVDLTEADVTGKGLEWTLRRSDSGKRACPNADYYTRVCTTTLDGTLRFLPVSARRRP